MCSILQKWLCRKYSMYWHTELWIPTADLWCRRFSVGLEGRIWCTCILCSVFRYRVSWVSYTVIKLALLCFGLFVVVMRCCRILHMTVCCLFVYYFGLNSELSGRASEWDINYCKLLGDVLIIFHVYHLCCCRVAFCSKESPIDGVRVWKCNFF
jgi:hypothetical protein